MKRVKLPVLSWLCLWFLVAEAHADEPSPPQLELGATASLSLSKFNQLSGATPGYVSGNAVGLAMRYPLGRTFALQPELVYMPRGSDVLMGAESSGKYRLRHLEVPLLLHTRLPRLSIFSPHVVAGPSVGIRLSSTVENPREEDVSDITQTYNFALMLGAGVTVDVAQVWGVTIEARYEHGLTDIYDTEVSIVTASRSFSLLVGVTWGGNGDRDRDGLLNYADRCWSQAEDMDQFKDDDGCADPDNDGDSLVDALDQCPNEAGTQITGGCPDSDGDGLVDALDQCANEAEDKDGLEDTDGCLDRDIDGDGILDVADSTGNMPDRCPAQPYSWKSDGCPPTSYTLVKVTPKSIEHSPPLPKLGAGNEVRVEGSIAAIEVKPGSSIIFEANKPAAPKKGVKLAALPPSNHPVADEIAKVLADYPNIRLRIVGHASGEGTLADNEALSQRRADAVYNYLLEKGIEPCRLVAKGVGETQPVSTEDSLAARELNRRVTFDIAEPLPGCPSTK